MAAIMAAIMEITENIMRRMHEPSTKLHNALYFMSGMMVVILALVIVAGVKTKAENAGFHIADDTENSYEQQVIQQQILDKVILIISFLIGNQKALNLECSNLADLIAGFVLPLHLNHILRHTVVINLKILIAQN